MKQLSTGIPARQLRRLAAITATAFALGASAQTYPAWAPDVYYAAGTVVTYNGHLLYLFSGDARLIRMLSKSVLSSDFSIPSLKLLNLPPISIDD